MSDNGTGVRARLDAWRQQGADRMDPVRFQRIDALQRRAADQAGAVRLLLDERLADLVDAYGADLETNPAHDRHRDGRATSVARPRSAMSALLDHFARQAVARDGTGNDAVATPSLPALGGLDDVRRICAHARTESQLRQALEQAPEDAGPLNSARLVPRALTLMRDLSPEYLQQFLSYVDALAWLDGAGLHGTLATEGTPSAASGGKRLRGKSPSRRA